MNKTKHNEQTKQLNCAERLMYLSEIASTKADCAAEIAKTKAECEAELTAKNEAIEYYRRAAELATRSKHRAINRRNEQRKDIIAWGIFAVGVALALWLAGSAIHTFLLWASGQ